MPQFLQSTTAIVWLGVALLIAALVQVRQLTASLPPCDIRRRWKLLGVMIFFVIGGYLLYPMSEGARNRHLAELVVPMVFFLGSCIVLIVSMMSLQTAHDIRRIALLERETITDALMCIYSRRYLEERLPQEIARAQRHALPLSLLMADIDHFKNVNDTWGHPVGDAALAALGHLVTATARSQDVVVRYGGEELVIIAADTDKAAAMTLAERLCRKVEETVLVDRGRTPSQPDVSVTLSIGVATLTGTSDDMAKLMRRADAALYQAKHEGRNRAVFGAVDPVA